MVSDFQAQLEEVERLVRDDRNQVGKRAGVPFIVFTYDPADEIEVDQEVRNLINKLEYHDQAVAAIDMRDLVFTVLEERGILENVIDLERRDRERLLDGLKSSLLDDGEMGQLASAIATQAEDADTVIVYRMGILYPFASASTLMGQLEMNTPDDTPIVFCYPAKVDNKSLRFLNESEGTYYRARVIGHE
ncbi:BREX protein BrxB domain-containing protein [Natrinema soli]|uniref:BREX protein BrxB domain-containing protein n=1 Tax=Natrinema soli TaxID=1930624 RepID=A0ABD5SPD4_9EURY|nr:BREX protein BrxB domain-containing protein [Natrinema soli]